MKPPKDKNAAKDFPVICVGGTNIAQKSDTAIRPDMPESAIGTGYIDFILSPEDIARKIFRITMMEGVDTDSDKTLTF